MNTTQRPKKRFFITDETIGYGITEVPENWIELSVSEGVIEHCVSCSAPGREVYHHVEGDNCPGRAT